MTMKVMDGAYSAASLVSDDEQASWVFPRLSVAEVVGVFLLLMAGFARIAVLNSGFEAAGAGPAMQALQAAGLVSLLLGFYTRMAHQTEPSTDDAEMEDAYATLPY